MSSIYIIKSKVISGQLNNMLRVFTNEMDSVIIETPFDIPDLKYKKIVFCLELNNIGYCNDVLSILSSLYERGNDSLLGSQGVLLIHSKNDLYTKSAASNIVFLANNLGCSFIGHPLVEAIGNLHNFLSWQKSLPVPLEDICIEQCKKLFGRFIADTPVKFERPRIVALHASSRNTSNTLMLWNMIKKSMTDCIINDLHVENGTVQDCIGCSFTACKHYSKQNSCFYGGVMISDIIPAIEKADAVVLICPNYNDAVSANLTAVINRITALYRKMSFYNKYLFSVVVSGNSGSDSVAKQIIDALNINKGFRLSPYSIIMETANDPGAIENVYNIHEKSKGFSDNIIKSIKK